ncbi:MAG TPA: glycosyltransferase family 39 protein [Candidatus Acidoferrales bacterium]|nr:glycosyltransferase family 39 protein [Candidatus Acidoferrales bacterium]
MKRAAELPKPAKPPSRASERLPVKNWLRTAATSLALVSVVALGLRLAGAWDYQRQNPKQALSVIPFLFESGDIAVSLATGHGFSSPFRVPTGPTAWMTPVYPLLLAGVFRAFGVYSFASWVAAVFLNILFSTLVCVPIYCAGRRIAGRGAGAAAAWLWAIFPNSILLSFQSMWDGCLSALLAATILWATLELAGRERARDWCGYGLLWGLALMTNATLGLLLPFLLGWLAWRFRRQGRPWAPRPALALAVVILSCVPWTIRNYVVFHAFVPLRSVLGLQLWMGNNSRAQAVWLGAQHPIFNPEERALYIRQGEIAYMRAKFRQAVQYMLAHPRREASLTCRRFLAIWAGGTPFPVRDYFLNHSSWFRGVLLFNLLAAIGALAGIVALFRRHSEYAFPAAVFPIVFPCAYYLTLALPRYRLPIDPMVLLLAAVALGAGFRTGSNH